MVECRSQAQLKLFGVPHCATSAGARLPAKGFLLVAALLLSPDQVMTRHAAASLLWDKGAEKRVLGNLRQLLLRLQKLCVDDDGLIDTDGPYLRAGALARSSDLWSFLVGSHAETVEERASAIRAVGGELLHGLETGHEQLHLWLLAERRRLKDLFFHCYVSTLDDLTRLGRARISDLSKLTEAALRADPACEETHRAAISAFARIGAVEECERLLERLQFQLSLERRAPDPATLALLKRVQSISVSTGDRSDMVASVSGSGSRGKQRVAFMRPLLTDGGSASPIIGSFVEDVANSLVRFHSFCVLATHSSFAVVASEEDEGFNRLRADYCVVTHGYSMTIGFPSP